MKNRLEGPGRATIEAQNELERQYRLEKVLAARLRLAPVEKRPLIYSQIYDELYREFPRLAGLSEDARLQRAGQVDLECLLLQPFLSARSRFIEYGAGDGALTRRIASEVERAWAVDASERLGGEAADPDNLELVTADGSPLPLPDLSIDLAYSCHFVEHLHPEDLSSHLQEVFRLLKAGGRYVCVTPNRLLGPHDVSKYFDDVASGLHLCEYTHGELSRMFRRAGFSNVRVVRKVGATPLAGATIPYLVAEAVVGFLPRSLRLRVLSVRASPFRPFEQVKLCAEKGVDRA